MKYGVSRTNHNIIYLVKSTTVLYFLKTQYKYTLIKLIQKKNAFNNIHESIVSI